MSRKLLLYILPVTSIDTHFYFATLITFNIDIATLESTGGVHVYIHVNTQSIQYI